LREVESPRPEKGRHKGRHVCLLNNNSKRGKRSRQWEGAGGSKNERLSWALALFA